MPLDAERHARLYYDRTCGSCSLFADATERIARGRIEVLPLDSGAADVELSGFAPAARYGSAHLVMDGVHREGSEIVVPLTGLALGSAVARLLERCPPIGRSLAFAYRTVQAHRQCR